MDSETLVLIAVFFQFLVGTLAVTWCCAWSASKVGKGLRQALMVAAVGAGVIFVLAGLVVIGFYRIEYPALEFAFFDLPGGYGVFVLFPLTMVFLSLRCVLGVTKRNREWLRPEAYEK